jgi:hypothetical protein
MQVAKIDNGVILEINDYRQMFLNTSFPKTGPGAEFMTENNLLYVYVSKPFNELTHQLVSVPPYIEGDKVYTVQIEELTSEQQTVREAARKQALIKTFTEEAQARLDNFAVERGYASIISVCTYDTSSVPRYAADALRARTLRDQWWNTLNQIMTDVLANTRAQFVQRHCW